MSVSRSSGAEGGPGISLLLSFVLSILNSLASSMWKVLLLLSLVQSILSFCCPSLTLSIRTTCFLRSVQVVLISTTTTTTICATLSAGHTWWEGSAQQIELIKTCAMEEICVMENFTAEGSLVRAFVLHFSFHPMVLDHSQARFDAENRSPVVCTELSSTGAPEHHRVTGAVTLTLLIFPP